MYQLFVTHLQFGHVFLNVEKVKVAIQKKEKEKPNLILSVERGKPGFVQVLYCPEIHLDIPLLILRN